ncbi:hypothetical protein ASPFODRAFT_85232 [Aspergillus luchuensis CBS 106.47]|uniref:Azaphilone pigments biosynthesis cluster protein L N-terminal domain-containing protein n=1 Tax=Aspergillus luchuensis (strain CBS 106.47) TaxID=1137211 RepID=A0A1M3T348_ASPLC|nr:hypothetical protein ASPFODRAFT_85232 [Aspergillus luchuensis CBS 106.47]
MALSTAFTVKRFRNRDKTLRRLQNELEDLTNILESLQQITNNERSMLALLQGPIDRCNQICSEFEQSIKIFNGKSMTVTISVRLGTITISTYAEIDEKLAQLTTEEINASDISLNLEDKRNVTKQCLRVCEDAKSYIESLETRESAILSNSFGSATKNNMQNMFKAQFLTRQALEKNRDSFAEIIGHLRKRLESQEDIQTSKQCLEVCKVASEISRQKIYRIGEVVADGDSDQVVKSPIQRKHMTEEALRHLTEKRYSNRFAALDTRSADVFSTGSPSVLETRRGNYSVGTSDEEQNTVPMIRHNRPSPNNMRKRAMASGAKSKDAE